MAHSLDSDEEYAAATEEVSRLAATLSEWETRWRDKQPFLEQHGYMLRPRYHAEWVPSWFHNGLDPESCEDYQPLPFRPNLIDATRVSDGRMVYIKRIQTNSNEHRIAILFTDARLRSDRRNHCVPVLEIFQDDEDGGISYMVMPFLRLADDPPFLHVNDIVEFVDQLMEGLVFMHEQGVAHRDCARKNVMMDATQLYPKGFHPVQEDFLHDLEHRAPVIPRIGVWPPVRYYFVDFGIAVSIPAEVQPKRAIGAYGLDQDVPELSFTTPYDPFKVDVFIVGNLFRKQVYAKFSNVNFMKPLIKAMTARNPEKRPDAELALRQWRQIRGGICFIHRGRLLRRADDDDSEPIVFDVIAFLKLGMLLSRRFLIWTARWLAMFNAIC